MGSIASTFPTTIDTNPTTMSDGGKARKALAAAVKIETELQSIRAADGGIVISGVEDAGDVVVKVKGYASQTADLIQFSVGAGAKLSGVTKDGYLSIAAGLSQSGVGSAGGATALPATPTGYMKIDVAGTTRVVPYYAAS